jgi:hypothetical protein
VDGAPARTMTKLGRCRWVSASGRWYKVPVLNRIARLRKSRRSFRLRAISLPTRYAPRYGDAARSRCSCATPVGGNPARWPSRPSGNLAIPGSSVLIPSHHGPAAAQIALASPQPAHPGISPAEPGQAPRPGNDHRTRYRHGSQRTRLYKSQIESCSGCIAGQHDYFSA